VFFVVFSGKRGAKRVDHRRPFVVRLRMNQRAGPRLPPPLELEEAAAQDGVEAVQDVPRGAALKARTAH
jgi:hypothetical protein